nr:hypothetical protein [Tanacetum cinerariifolium]
AIFVAVASLFFWQWQSSSLAVGTSTASGNSISGRFEDPDHPDKVYKVVKALYGLHQAPKDWVGKGCSGVKTPLFDSMLVAREPENQGDAEVQGDAKEQSNDDNAAEEPVTAVDDVEDQTIQSPTPLTPPPPQPQNIPSTSQVQSPLPQQQSPPPAQPQGADFPMSLLQEALDACTTLARRVEHLEHDKVAQDLEIIKLKSRVKKLERTNKVKTMNLRRLRKVGTSQSIESSDDTIMKDVSNQGRMIDKSDKDEGAELMNEREEKETEKVRVNPDDAEVEGRQANIYHIDMDHATKVLISAAAVVQADVLAAPVNVAAGVTIAALVKVVVSSTRRRRGVVIRDLKEESSAKTPTETKSKDKGKGIMVEEPKPMKKKQQVELDEVYARKIQEELNQDIDWEVPMDHVKQKAKENPYVQRYQECLMKTYVLSSRLNSMQMEEEDCRAIALINETPAQKAAKRRRLNKEAEDVEELKQHLEIMSDEDDDVYTEATPLARKVPVVDYQIIHVNNKPRYKIIRVDNTHQLYTSFITMLKNFDRDDLETLWSIVKESFGVDAAMVIKEKHQVFTAASEDICAAMQKLMLLVTVAK